MNTEKTIPVLVFRDTNSGEADEVYRLDEPGSGDRFFTNLLNNTERNDIHHLRLEEWTEDQMKLADLAGEYFGEAMPDDKLAEYEALKNKVGKRENPAWPS